MKISFSIFLSVILLITSTTSWGQVIQGKVYDITKHIPLEAVVVLTTSGHGGITDSIGYYQIPVEKGNDSIYFEYEGKKTNKFPVASIANPYNFDISIQVQVAELPTVTIKSNSYRYDSIANRETYSKIFNYQRPGLASITSPYTGSANVPALGAAFDLDGIINSFRFRRNRMTEAFQARLIQEEQDKYVEHRFNKAFITRITQLKTPLLDTFIQLYRPSFALVTKLNELELGYYIEESYKLFTAIRNNKAWRPNNVELNLPTNNGSNVNVYQ